MLGLELRKCETVLQSAGNLCQSSSVSENGRLGSGKKKLVIVAAIDVARRKRIYK